MDEKLTLALYALKEEARHVWMQSMDSHIVNLVALQRSWDQLIKELCRLDRGEK